MSYYTSLSGLKASQTDLATIANNVANAGSVGFKKSRAVFGDVFAAGRNQASNMIAGSGTRLNGIQQQFGQGSFEGTNKTLDLAIAGEGFFTVQGPAPMYAVTFTRNGAFSTNDQREVVDTLGNKLQLMPVDPATGAVTSIDQAQMFDFVLPLDDGGLPASARTASTINATTGAVTVTFANGGTRQLTPAVTLPDDDGATPPNARTGVSIDDATGVVTATFAGGGTQNLGTVTLPADDGGTPPSELASVAIDEAGLVTATFANGTSEKLGAVAMASFNNVEGLRSIGDAHWQASGKSGNPKFGAAGSGSLGNVRSGQLERANVDVTEELVALISAQRNFQANAKAIETANNMNQAINNIRT